MVWGFPVGFVSLLVCVCALLFKRLDAIVGLVLPWFIVWRCVCLTFAVGFTILG